MNAVETADMPDENSNVPYPPSKLLSVWLAASVVGLFQREYSHPSLWIKQIIQGYHFLKLFVWIIEAEL